jgi:hypothetical protein
MTEWMTTATRLEGTSPMDYEILQETAIGMAQLTIQKALNGSSLKGRSGLAEKMGRPRSFITRMLSGGHNLTIKTFALALAACGFEPTFGFQPIQWGWMADEPLAITYESSPTVGGGQFHGNASSVAMEVPIFAIAL